ncbi:hypothetical protein ILUMI_00992 [Ignelater luminosus]|uniref:ubiquitinyl hydrolase 1 n=1 Tax=Ignelater luminosus TaxID=2038154 RepID=A0A8K0DKW7_IGNLU|nr:hypothetical protein ILUMI_00992 [Ignelater luminosus]
MPQDRKRKLKSEDDSSSSRTTVATGYRRSAVRQPEPSWINSKAMHGLFDEVLQFEINNSAFQRGGSFKRYLESTIYDMKTMKSDGACFFRAIAYQQYEDQSFHVLVRMQCMEFLRANRVVYEPFITGDFEEYIARKSRVCEYADNVEIQAVADMYQRNVEIYQYNVEHANNPEAPPVIHYLITCSNEPRIMIPDISIYSGALDPFRLSYHGDLHYNALIIRGSDKKEFLDQMRGTTKKPSGPLKSILKHSEHEGSSTSRQADKKPESKSDLKKKVSQYQKKGCKSDSVSTLIQKRSEIKTRKGSSPKVSTVQGESIEKRRSLRIILRETTETKSKSQTRKTPSKESHESQSKKSHESQSRKRKRSQSKDKQN